MELLLWVVGIYLFYRIFFKKKTKKPAHKSNNTSISSTERLETSYRKKVVQGKSNHEDDDGLATFTISFDSNEEKSKNTTEGRWVPRGEKISIKGIDINTGFIYFGGRLNAYYNFASKDYYYGGLEASLVDESLDIEVTLHNYQDESLAYWPTFSSISPKCRGAYLNWLSSSRSNPATPIGYVFLYFYGLERRILVDGKSGKVEDLEFSDLHTELLRLNSIYAGNRSFNRYCSRLIEIMSILRPNIISMQNGDDTYESPLCFKLKLARTVTEGLPIPPPLALNWVKHHPEYNLRTPARRCTEEFSELFKQQYQQKYDEGFLVKPNKTKLILEYHPASSTLRGIELEQPNLPDPSILKAPLKKLITIADTCTNLLEPYSRYLGKKNTSKNDISAILLLPPELINTNGAEVITTFQRWATERIQNDNGLVKLEDFWRHTGTPLPEKMNKKEIDLIQNLASKAGYGIAPDSRYHNAKPTLGSNIVLFSGGHGEYFEASKYFNELAMTLRLGAMVAAIDSHIDDGEVNYLKQQITHNDNLSPSEKNSLNAYLTWLLNCPQKMTGLKAKLEPLSKEQKGAISRILISVALVDGKIEPTEIKQLEKLYTQLGLDNSVVASDIHIHTTSKPTAQVTINETRKPALLDKATLASHESETREVQNMLGAIFVDDDPVEPNLSMEVEGLDSYHNELYQLLVSKEKWTRIDISEHCQRLGLLVDGAIETINDWSFELVDAPVLEDDDDIYVDLDVVTELKG